jgi:phosphopantetheinyl transferase (holo-ACP synthase)
MEARPDEPTPSAGLRVGVDVRPNPTLRLWGEAGDLARELGLVSLLLSLSYQSRLAVALVVGELGESPLHS